MSKETQIETGLKIREHYKCEVIIDEIQEPHVLFNLHDIGKLLQISNIRSNTRNDDKIHLKRKTNGGEQLKSFVNYKALCKLLAKCRKPTAIDVCTVLKFDVNSVIYACIEADTLKCIIESFNGEQMIAQHKFGKYMVDLYMPLYNIIIECDESHHKAEVSYDTERENVIKQLSNGCVFIRYDPYSTEFNMFKTINRIYNTIKSMNISRDIE